MSLYLNRILSTFTNNRYEGLQLKKNGSHKFFFIHRLVALHFIPNPLNKPQINHIDGNTKNNKVWNLEWCTAQENRIHADKLNLIKYRLGENHPGHKLTEIKVREIREKYSTGKYTQQQLADEYKVQVMTINKIIKFRTWK